MVLLQYFNEVCSISKPRVTHLRRSAPNFSKHFRRYLPVVVQRAVQGMFEKSTLFTLQTKGAPSPGHVQKTGSYNAPGRHSKYRGLSQTAWRQDQIIACSFLGNMGCSIPTICHIYIYIYIDTNPRSKKKHKTLENTGQPHQTRVHGGVPYIYIYISHIDIDILDCAYTMAGRRLLQKIPNDCKYTSRS